MTQKINDLFLIPFHQYNVTQVLTTGKSGERRKLYSIGQTQLRIWFCEEVLYHTLTPLSIATFKLQLQLWRVEPESSQQPTFPSCSLHRKFCWQLLCHSLGHNIRISHSIFFSLTAVVLFSVLFFLNVYIITYFAGSKIGSLMSLQS